jgi:hypothetical protein
MNTSSARRSVACISILSGLLALSGLTACRQSASSPEATAPTPVAAAPAPPPAKSADVAPQPEATPASAVASLEKDVRKGMAYADFREKAFASGWKPLPDPQCAANVAGADHATVCKDNADLMTCRICGEMPELSAYSGDGHSLSYFVHPATGAKLAVTAVGELEGWSLSGEDAGLQVLSWELADSNAPAQ